MEYPSYFPSPPPMGVGPAHFRPEEVQLCAEAASRGDADEVKRLVQKLLHEPRPATEPQTPEPAWLYKSFCVAMQNQDLELLRFLLDEKVVADHGTFTAELEAGVRGRVFQVLEFFLQLGKDINTRLHRNEPPVLCVALALGDAEMVEWLLDHGADPNARCAWGFTPTSVAMHQAPLELVDLLFKRGADVQRGQLLQWAIHRKKPDTLDVVRRLVERGAPIDEVKYEKEPEVFCERKPFGLGTPLHRAAELGEFEVVKYLLEQGADPLKLDSRGKVPRHWAEVRKHPEIAQILKDVEERPFNSRI